MTTRFALDKSQGRLLGVCAGLSRSTGWDANVVRIAAVLLTLFALGPFGLLLYLVTGLVAESR